MVRLARHPVVLAGAALAAALLAVWLNTPAARHPGAADEPGRAGDGRPAPEDVQRYREQARTQLLASLNLSQAQQTTVAALLAQRDARREAMVAQAGDAADPEAVRRARQEFGAFSADIDRRIEAVLDEEQRSTYRAWRERRGWRGRADRRGDGGGVRI